MKKVGIVSCYFKNNYGSMLQAYATKKILDNNNIPNTYNNRKKTSAIDLSCNNAIHSPCRPSNKGRLVRSKKSYDFPHVLWLANSV